MLSHIAHDPQPADSGADLAARRLHAEATWQAAGLPNRRLEAWRHTNLRPMTSALRDAANAEPASAERAGAGLTGSVAADPSHAVAPLDGVAGVIVLVDGALDLAASTVPAGLRAVDLAIEPPTAVGSIAPLDRLEDALNARNLGQFDRGLGLLVPSTCQLQAPLELRYTYTRGGGASVESRLFIALERHAELSLIERHVSADGLVLAVNHVVEVQLDDGATLRHTQVQQQSVNAYHLGKCAVYQARDSRYEAQVAQFGGSIGRSDVEVFLAGPGATCQIDGFYHGHDTQHLDNHSTIHHLASHTTSGQHYKGVLDDRATGIFRGNVLIYPNAQGCATQQLNRNLLLSDGATVHTKPQLEIDNDDVTASHGATVGQLNEEALFYLQSRGIAPPEARRLLIFAFAGEIVANVALPSLRALLHDELAVRLARL